MLPAKRPNDGLLVIKLDEQQWVKIGDVYVQLIEVRGNAVRICIQADKSVAIVREDAKIKEPRNEAVQDLRQADRERT